MGFPARHFLTVKKSVLILSLIASASLPYGQANINRKIGIQFLSFEYVNAGQLLDGSCCDGQGTQGACAASACDTAFLFCLTHRSNGSTCDPSFETTPLVNTSDVTSFGKQIDPSVTNSTSSLIVLPVSTMEDINIAVTVFEVDPPEHAISGSLQGNFSSSVNETELFNLHPDWTSLHFDNGVIRLSLNVTSYCAPHWYGPSCDIYCNDRRTNFTCNQGGSKVCRPGYEDESKDCNTVTDLCVSHPCLQGATCQKQVNNFTCTCPAGFTAASVSPFPTNTASSSQTTGSGVPTTRTIPTNATHSEQTDSSSGTNIGVILGPLAALLLLGLAALLLFLWFQRKRKRAVEPEENAEKGTSEDGKAEQQESPEKENPDSEPSVIQDSSQPPSSPAAV